MKRVLLSNAAASLAMDAAVGTAAESPFNSPEVWAELGRAGVATGAEELHAAWAEALATMQNARLVHHLASQYGDLVHLTDVFLDGPYTISALRRFQVDQASGEAIRADPEVELTVALGYQVWELVKRTLPPFVEFSAEPAQVPAEQESELELPKAALPGLNAILEAGEAGATQLALVELLATIPELSQAQATLTCVSIARRNAQESAPGIAVMVWALSPGGLHRIATGDRIGIFRTLPGDVGFRLTWTTLGMVGALSAAERGLG